MNGNSERVNNYNGVDNHWDSLSDIPFNTGGGYKTESGIIVTGGAGQAMAEKDMGIERPVAEAPRSVTEQPAVEAQPVAEAGVQAQPVAEAEAQVQPVAEAQPQPVEEQQPATNAYERLAEEVQAQSVAEVQSATEAQPAVESQPAIEQQTAEAPTALQVEAPAAQSAEQLQPGAVEDFINKINSATNDKEIEEAVKLGYEITSGVNNLSAEEKQRAQEFMASPIFRKRQLENDIAINEKRLSGMEDTIRRSEEEYKQVRKGGPMTRFTNRFRIKESKERVARAKKIHENALGDIARWREELAKFDSSNEEAA